MFPLSVVRPPTDVQGPAKKKSNEFLYDIGGWVILTVAVVAWLSILNARAPPQPNDGEVALSCNSTKSSTVCRFGTGTVPVWTEIIPIS